MGASQSGPGDCGTHERYAAPTSIFARGRHRPPDASEGSAASGKALGEVARVSPDAALQRHIIRTAKIPFLESRASGPIITTTIIIAAIGIAPPFSWLGDFPGFVRLPPAYWIALCLIVPSYVILTHVAKTWFIRRFGLS